MTIEEVLKSSEWDDIDFAHLQLYSPLFDKKIPIEFSPHWNSEATLEREHIVNDLSVRALNDFLNLPKGALDEVKDFLWQDCKRSFENIHYGFDASDGESDIEATQRGFGIYNIEDAYANSNFERVVIHDNASVTDNAYFGIQFLPVWEDEHGVCVIGKNGKLIATYSNDVTFSDDAVFNS